MITTFTTLPTNQPNITPQTINQSLNPTCQPNIDGAALTLKCLQRSVLGRGLDGGWMLVLVCQLIIEPAALTFKCIDGSYDVPTKIGRYLINATVLCEGDR